MNRPSLLLLSLSLFVVTACKSSGARTDAMVRVPGGTFQMGSEGVIPSERPVHAVDVMSFDLDRTEVTVQAYSECVSSGACGEPDKYEGALAGAHMFCNWHHPEGRATHPINCVDWPEAAKYCAWRGKRLPTEEEWEYAARRGGRTYPWGNEAPSERLVNACGPDCMKDGASKGFGWSALPWGNDGWPESAPVGSFPKGASIDGAQDLIGNVWEWTSSAFSEDYSKPAATDDRVGRGGSWSNSNATSLRPTGRLRLRPTTRLNNLGFRCAK
jgi:formylglycine-generating enzyme required for sulfatase activity